ncbi:MAG: HAMP domain-containing histidine kinase [Pelomonas sp.]|nr:HAMP domain-containing histidine kinase [Roseateles sp.]
MATRAERGAGGPPSSPFDREPGAKRQPWGHSLASRIVAAHVLLVIAVAALFAVVFEYAREQVDHYVVRRRLEVVSEWRLHGGLQPGGAQMTPEVAFYRGAEIPAYLVDLPPGFQSVDDGQHALDALVGATPDGQRWVAVDLVSDFEHVEHRIYFLLAACLAAAGSIATLLALATTGRVLEPLTALTRAVRSDTLADAPELLARRDEIGVLARVFAAHAEALRAALDREQLFTGDVSHELRTPLAVMRGAAEVLALQPQANEAARAAIERIERTARDAAGRVTALLLLSRAPERLGAPRIELHELCERELRRCEPLLAGMPVALRLDGDARVHVHAAPELVEMVVGNLLRNACQHTREGAIVVRLERAALSVTDTGPGLPPQVAARLFERIEPVQAPRDGRGAGLGLAIVKRIVEHLGWRVRVEQPGAGGTRFLIEFSEFTAP